VRAIAFTGTRARWSTSGLGNAHGLVRNRLGGSGVCRIPRCMLKEKALGPDHPDVATSLNNLALLYHVQGLHEQAEPLYNRSLAIMEKALGPEHPKSSGVSKIWRRSIEQPIVKRKSTR
jgi:Tetratricopeptide repeat